MTAALKRNRSLSATPSGPASTPAGKRQKIHSGLHIHIPALSAGDKENEKPSTAKTPQSASRSQARPAQVMSARRALISLSVAKESLPMTPSPVEGKKEAAGSSVAYPGSRDTIQAQCTDLLKLLRSSKDAQTGRYHYRLFHQLPSRKLYPDYYDIIQHPVCLQTIREQVDSNHYMTLASFKKDIHLMFANARKYNLEGSMVFEDAKLLQKLFDEAYRKLEPSTPALPKVKRAVSSDAVILPKIVIKSSVKSTSDAGKSTTPTPKATVLKDYVKTLVTAILGNDIKGFDAVLKLAHFNPNILMDTELFGQHFKWGPLHCAAYHGQDKMIMKLCQAGADVELADTWYGGTPLAWAAFGDQVQVAKLLVHQFGAKKSSKNSQGQIPFDLVSTPTDPGWVGVLIDEPIPVGPAELEVDGKRVAGLPLFESMLKIYDGLISWKDLSGRCYSDIFMQLPSKKEYPDYYALIEKPLSFNVIKKRLDGGAYETFQKFEMDMLQIFENAMFYNQKGSVIYNDAERLKAAFEKIAQDYKTERKTVESAKMEPKVKNKATTAADGSTLARDAQKPVAPAVRPESSKSNPVEEKTVTVVKGPVVTPTPSAHAKAKTVQPVPAAVVPTPRPAPHSNAQHFSTPQPQPQPHYIPQAQASHTGGGGSGAGYCGYWGMDPQMAQMMMMQQHYYNMYSPYMASSRESVSTPSGPVAPRAIFPAMLDRLEVRSRQGECIARLHPSATLHGLSITVPCHTRFLYFALCLARSGPSPESEPPVDVEGSDNDDDDEPPMARERADDGNSSLRAKRAASGALGREPNVHFERVSLQTAVANANQSLSTADRHCKAFRDLDPVFGEPETQNSRFHYHAIRLRPGLTRLDWTVVGRQWLDSDRLQLVQQTYRVVINRF